MTSLPLSSDVQSFILFLIIGWMAFAVMYVLKKYPPLSDEEIAKREEMRKKEGVQDEQNNP